MCAEAQKRLANLVDELVIGNVMLRKSTMEWEPTSNGENWIQTWDDHQLDPQYRDQ
ncbi:hypothetical protein CALCODRAFT_500501 [Calocera cornea HHB12733]|uniref:Uncharacterized protein n=1 Tax=Calocera cornea HHB12733 TaxID=1353952 RepID=A0A165E274_9BASI|nr:hypothetical protein CALCODRAFT_500501 [Calocera cornea HHB12733]